MIQTCDNLNLPWHITGDQLEKTVQLFADECWQPVSKLDKGWRKKAQEVVDSYRFERDLTIATLSWLEAGKNLLDVTDAEAKANLRSLVRSLEKAYGVRRLSNCAGLYKGQANPDNRAAAIPYLRGRLDILNRAIRRMGYVFLTYEIYPRTEEKTKPFTDLLHQCIQKAIPEPVDVGI